MMIIYGILVLRQTWVLSHSQKPPARRFASGHPELVAPAVKMLRR